ncbi:MAG TPA: efflux RND transporter periplasmic adaptor subunit [Rhodocyclaceae bacterium]
MRRLPLALLMIALLGGGGWWWFHRADEAPKARVAAPVTTAKAEARDLPLRLDLVGRAEAFESVTLKARIDGQVSAVPFQEGQAVKQGEVLLRLDPADFQARLRQAEAGLARDQAQLNKARNDLERANALAAKGFVSEQNLIAARSAVDTQLAALKGSQAALELARLQLDYTVIRAPFAGVVGTKLVFPGAAVKINETALAVVNRIKPLTVSFTIAEKFLPAVQAALKRGVLQADVGVPGSGDHHYPGQVRVLDNAVDPASGTIRMKAQLPNEQGELTPGQFLDVSLVLDTLKDAITVPAAAVQQGPEGFYVFVVKADSSAELRRVEVSTNQQGLAVIAKGLQAGETVVVEGHLRITPGAMVAPRDGKAPPAAAPSS